MYHYLYDVMYCYCRAHIPLAVYFDLYKCCTGTKEIPLNLPDPECWTTYIQSLGVSSDTHVVVYDGQNMRLALRTWWLFRVGPIKYEVAMGREIAVNLSNFYIKVEGLEPSLCRICLQSTFSSHAQKNFTCTYYVKYLYIVPKGRGCDLEQSFRFLSKL